MPDFGFWAWPEPMGAGKGGYDEIREAALEREQAIAAETTPGSEYPSVTPASWAGKTPKLLWRGAPMVPIRHQLLAAVEGQEWSDVGDVNWEELGGKYKTMADHCQYK